MGKIGICTVFTGYNFGSSLQALAIKQILNNIGYDSELLSVKGSFVKGRDIRLYKILVIVVRMLLHVDSIKQTVNIYCRHMKKHLPLTTVALFDDFTEKYLQPLRLNYFEMKRRARGTEFTAFICGSDQIWNSSSYYVDPFYYLRFAPQNKRIAFAPSFGRDFIPNYNKKIINKYIQAIPYKSVREQSGRKIIFELTGESVETLLDPTLILSADQWHSMLIESMNIDAKYILAYFLDSPSKLAVDTIKQLKERTGYKVIGLPYAFPSMSWCDKAISAGPREFITALSRSSIICTDSFHGTAFSINFNIPFYTFERNYGNADKQSTRIMSLLTLTGLTCRFNPMEIYAENDIDFEKSNEILNKERARALSYLMKALESVLKQDGFGLKEIAYD